MDYRHFLIVKYLGWTNYKPVRFFIKTSWPSCTARIYRKGIIPDEIPGGQEEYEWMANHFIQENGIHDLEIDCAIHSGKDSITFILKKKGK